MKWDGIGMWVRVRMVRGFFLILMLDWGATIPFGFFYTGKPSMSLTFPPAWRTFFPPSRFHIRWTRVVFYPCTTHSAFPPAGSSHAVFLDFYSKIILCNTPWHIRFIFRGLYYSITNTICVLHWSKIFLNDIVCEFAQYWSRTYWVRSAAWTVTI